MGGNLPPAFIYAVSCSGQSHSIRHFFVDLYFMFSQPSVFALRQIRLPSKGAFVILSDSEESFQTTNGRPYNKTAIKKSDLHAAGRINYFSDKVFYIFFIVARILKTVFCADTFAPLACDFLIRIVIDVHSLKAVLTATQAPIGAPHSVSRCLVSPQAPVVTCFFECAETVCPRCCAERIELAHKLRHIREDKLHKPGGKIK